MVAKLQALLVAALLSLVPGFHAQFCANFPNNGSIPSLDEQFSFRVEANFAEHNRTMIVHELYDSINNRGSLYSRYNGSDLHVIFDYNTDQFFALMGPRSDQTCYASSITGAPTFATRVFGVTTENGTIRIGTASAFILQLQSNPNVTDLGYDTVRGIPVRHWQACFDQFNSTFTADYYFSTNTWDYTTLFNSNMNGMIPILITIQGNRTEDDGVENFYHVYSIFNYQAGPDSVHDRQFQVPLGQVCRGRIAGSPTPTVPNFFSATFQYTFNSDMTSNVVNYLREFYHLSHKLYRIDAYYDGSLGGSAGPVTVVHDFNTQIEYIINRHTSSCIAASLGNGSYVGFDLVADEEGDNQRLLTPRELFLLQDQFNYTYEGVVNMRGVPVDAWLSVRDFETFGTSSNLTNGKVELFFTRPDYNVSSIHSSGESVIPWVARLSGVVSYSNGTNIFQTNISMEIDISDFSSDEPPYDAFDVSTCFPDSDVHTLIIAFNASLSGVDFANLRTNLRNSIIEFTSLQPLQINNIQLLRSNDTSIILSVHLANLTSIAKVPSGSKLITSHAAFTKIVNQSMMANGVLPFKVPINGTLIAPRLLFFGRGRNVTLPSNCSTNNNNKTCDDNITNQLKLTDGAVAGIALGLFFGGLLIGILATLITCCICKCLCGERGSFDVAKSSSVKYKKHDDELDNIS